MKKHPYLISFIIFIIVFFIINKISKNFLEITKWEKDNRKSYVEKVYGKEQVKDYLKVIEEQTSALKYEPFIEFKEQPRSGKFVSVSQKGNRCNKNDIPNCDGPLGGKNEIWIFGGSTTFGYGVKNNETIPAYLENFYEGKKKVINFGSGYYYSNQERILFQKLLQNYESPYAAVFIDGVNDFGYFWNFNETAYTETIRSALEKNNKSKNKFIEWVKKRFVRLNIYRLIDEKFFKEERLEKNNKKNLTDKKVVRSIDILKSIGILKKNHEINVAVGNFYKIKIVNVLQPSPIHDFSYKNSNIPKQYLPKEDDEYSSNVKLGYEILKNKNIFEDTNFFLDLNDLEINKAMYVDGYHYTPIFNKMIANQIYNYLIIK